LPQLGLGFAPLVCGGRVPGQLTFHAMNIKGLTEQQKQGLLDLVMLAMYADGHLAAAEDERVLRLVDSMGLTTEYERGQCYDAAVTRVSRHSQTAEKARAYAHAQAQAFTTPEERRFVVQTLDDIVTSDSHVSEGESNFLALVREVLEK
jgi:uncharacterized tellurite resistance protein B-like protein